jgi:hypothetical protein
MALKWQILTLTMPTRVEFLAGLRKILEPQLRDGVEWIVKVSDPSISLGANREQMRRDSTAEYINFCDDDDELSPNYVARILPLLDRDYVGFWLQAFEDGVPLPKRTKHSLTCNDWFEGDQFYGRDISHLNPIKRELAIQVPIYGGFGEDSRWAGDIRKLKIVQTERFVDDVMYYYYSRTDKTDGVKPGRFSAGVCPHCGSESTVVVDREMVCNACAARSEFHIS